MNFGVMRTVSSYKDDLVSELPLLNAVFVFKKIVFPSLFF